MKKLKLVFVALAMITLFSVVVYNSDAGPQETAKTELAVVPSASVQLEVKEHMKLDNAEYKSAVSTASSFAGSREVGLGIAAAIAAAIAYFMSKRYSKYNRTANYIKFGLSSFVAGLVMLYFSGMSLGFTMLGVVPFLKFDKVGLSGDNLKFVEELETRIKGLGSDDEVKKLFKADLDLAIREFKEQLDNLKELKPDQVAKLKEYLGEDDKGIRSILLKQGEAITKLKANLEHEEVKLDLRSQVKEWNTKHKELITRVKNGEKLEMPVLEIRAAASPMTPANTLSDTISINAGAAIRQGAPVFDLRRIQPTLWDYINKGRTGLETYPWVNKKVPADSGSADFIGPGVAKPGVSFTLEVEKSNAKKVAVSLKTATELLDDVDGMTNFIQDELAYQLKSEANRDLMTQTESSTKVAGLQTFSLPFTTSGLETTNPNNWDVCRAIICQIRLAFISSPVVIFMNPVDVANMDMDKSISLGVYSGIAGRPIPGGIIVEDINMTAGYVQAVALDLWKNLIYKDFSVKWGWENADFTLNLVTAIAELRMHSFHSENDAAGFVYDAINDVKSAIAAA